MATFKNDTTLKYVTTKNGDIEETEFSAGTEVQVMQAWKNADYVLIKDDDGHFYNAPSSVLDL